MAKQNKPEKGLYQLRKGRYSVKNGFYFITFCCSKKQKIFLEKENAEIVFDSLDWLEKNKYIDLYFCIVMPDHVHLILQLIGNKVLSEVIKSLKQFTGKKIKQNIGLTTNIWQEGFYDHYIRQDESLLEVVKYSWFNPVRKGLVEDPNEYPYWKSKYKL